MTEKTTASSQVVIIRESILGFLNTLNSEKRLIEQQIREKSEAIKSQFFSHGSTQFTFSQVNQLTNTYRDEYLTFYQNSIHLKLLATASSHLRSAIEYGFINSGIVQQEWLEAYNSLQSRIDEYELVMSKLEDTEKSLEVEKKRVNELQVGATLTQGDMLHFENLLKEKDQVIAEKDQEILNLSEGLSRMETQVNSMGQSLLQNSMTIEDLQETIGEKDDEIFKLKDLLQSSSSTSAELDTLREQLKTSQMRINELENQVSAASGDLVDQLQENLQQTRDELLKTRKELVNKNEEIYQIKLVQDETNVKFKRVEEQLHIIEADHKLMLEEHNKLSDEFQSLQESNGTLEVNYEKSVSEITELNSKIQSLEIELKESNEKLATFEGKTSLTPEQQAEYDRKIEELEAYSKKSSETIKYFRKVLAQDVKFKTLIFLDTINEEIRLDELSKAIGLPQEMVHRAVIELSEAGFAKGNKEGRYFYVSRGGHHSPFSLEEVFA